MLKNRFMMAFAFVGLLGLTACAGEEEAAVVEEPVVEEPAAAPVVEPAPVAEPAVGEAGAATEILGNGIDDDGDGLIDEEV